MSGEACAANANLQPQQVEHDKILHKAEEWLDAGLKVAIATVVHTWGSSPRPVGSQLVVNEEAKFEGSVSGGCIESAVVTEALDIMEGSPAQLMEFGVSDAMAWEVGLACGGTIKVYVEKLDRENSPVFTQIRQAQKSIEAIVSITNLTSGEAITWQPGQALPEKYKQLEASCEKAIRLDKGHYCLLDQKEEVFINPHNPAMRMFIIGAVHISQALAPMAQATGYDVTVIDHRTAWANAERFPNVALDQRWADEALEEHGLNHRSAVVTLTHDPKLDDPALIHALKSKAFYIGALGSKKTHAARVERLKEEGFQDEDINQIDAPIGLDIGAASPAEIAVAILGQVTLALRGPKGMK